MKGFEMSYMKTFLVEMIDQYVETLLWVGQDYSRMIGDNPTPMDENFGAEDVSAVARQEIEDDCHGFLTIALDMDGAGSLTAEDFGHNFALTRNGHGAGFWDKGWGELGAELTTWSKTFGEQDLYVGDDGKLYV
jgi:hypothetical protein